MQKRERSINFTREEVDTLIKLVGERKHVLENKKSDASTWSEKEQCWKTIEASFNSVSGVTHRTAKNLRLKYEAIKRETRKKSALIRAETYRTGGGPSNTPSLTPSEEKVKDMILLSVDGMESNYDSDQVPNAVGIPITALLLPECNAPSMDKENKLNLDMEDPDELIPSLSNKDPLDLVLSSENDTLQETPVRPVKRTLLCNQFSNNMEITESLETHSKWSQWKPSSLRAKKHPALSKPKTKRPFERMAESKIEIAELQKIITEEEILQKKSKWAFEEKKREQEQKRWDFEEEERNHKREMWAFEKELMLKKTNQNKLN